MTGWTKKIFLVFVLAIATITAQAQTWTVVATDVAGDEASPLYLDATKFEYAFLNMPDSLYFRITLANINTSQSMNFGAFVMINLPGQGFFNFWGNENADKWTKLVTVKVSGTAPSAYTGTIGISNSIGVNQQNFTNLSSNNIKIVMDTVAKTIVLGMDRKDLIPNSDLGGNTTITLKTAAAVGTSSSWNDDVYDTAGQLTLTNVRTGLYIQTPNQQNALRVYPNPASSKVFIELENENTGCEFISLTNAVGRQVFATSNPLVSANTIEVATDALPNGIYFANVHSKTGNVYCQKFAIIK
jgi:hypothetical protein